MERDEGEALYEQQKAWEDEQEFNASEEAKAIANLEAKEAEELNKSRLLDRTTIDEAIKRLQQSIAEIGDDEEDTLTRAEKLGIEALKLYNHNKHIGQHIDPTLLPGETEE